jgi:hypothetical protein
LTSTSSDLVQPAHLTIPPRASSAGAEVVDLAATYGRILDAEQALVVDAILSEGPDGNWAALEAAVVAPGRT